MNKLSLPILLCFAALCFPAPTHGLTIEAVKARVHPIGREQNGVWNLWSNGEVGDFFQFDQAGRYVFRVIAYGSPAGGGWPEMMVMVDDRQLGMIVLSNAQPASFEFPFETERGTHRLTVSFLNDLMMGKEDRNLYVVSLAVEPTSGLPSPLIGDAQAWRQERRILETALEKKVLTAAALAIEQNRKGDATVRVIDAQGKPIEGAPVAVELTRHEFLFGCNIFGFDHHSNPAQNELYKQKFRDLFNYATSGFYWIAFERERGKPNYDYIDKVTGWCRTNGIRVKGHPLLWGNESGIPPWSKGQPDPATQERRVREIVERYKGRIEFWEVVNEPSHEMSIKIDDPYRWAREANPTAHLIVNDYFILADGGPSFRRLLVTSIQNGVPFDGIGIQAHEPANMRFPLHRVKAILDDYATLGKALHITEFTPASNGEPVVGSAIGGVWDEARQAEYAENFYRVCFSHPAMQGITWWDLSDGGSWRKGGGLLHPDLSPKPAYEALRKLIHEEWMTWVEGVTDHNGVFAFRGYYGNYKITVNRGAESRSDAFSLALGKDNSWVMQPGAPAK